VPAVVVVLPATPMSTVARPARPTLLFIPDISGFTQFVRVTEITHSRHVIEELLEALIDANELGLSVSEVEGDAILFYREGPAPTAAELLAQIQRMYVRFHALLRRYDTHRICQCGACSAASGLTLKFIAHYGEVGTNQVKTHSKLFGRDVIVAHRLLKNQVPHGEYVLLTHDLVNACATWVDIRQAAWADPEEGAEQYDSGPVEYCHIPLQALRAQVPEPTVEDFSLPGATERVATHDTVIEAPIDLVFDVVADLSARHHWMVGLKDSDRLNHKIPQHGATHRCVIKESEKDPHLVSHDFKAGGDFITFTETERRQGWAAVFTFRRIGAGTTRLEKHLFLGKNLVIGLLFRLFMRKKYMQETEQSAARLNAYCKELVREGRSHPAQIVLGPPPTAGG